MLTEIQKPDSDFNVYYRDNALLIQLLLVEFLTTQQLTHQALVFFDSPTESYDHLEKFILPLFDYFDGLLGKESNETSSSSRPALNGSLTKMKNYCRQFLKNQNDQNKNSLALYDYVHQTWLSAIKNMELLNTLQHRVPTKLTTSSFIKMKKAIAHFNKCLNHIKTHIPKVVYTYWENENVMFFLIRKKEQFIAVYGPDYIAKFFKTLTKKQQIIELLIKKYEGRGFSHLVSPLYS